MPHDKIASCIDTGHILQAEVVPMDSLDSEYAMSEQGHISNMADIDTSIQYKEIYSPMNDPLLQQILSLAPNIYSPSISHGPRWIPTVALGILQNLFECRPNSSVAFADFDWLPPPDVDSTSTTQQQRSNFSLAEQAVGDPLVTDMNGNDHSCYLTSPPNALCDILFPTDFGSMAKFASKVIEQSNTKTNQSVDVSVLAMKQRDFLLKYGHDEVDKTKGWTGYSPLIDDFGNTSLLTITPR